MERTLFDADHELFRDSVRGFIRTELVPHHEDWERAGIVDRDVFRKAGALGFLGMAVPEELGGGGVTDFRYNVVIAEEIQRAGVNAAGLGWTLHNDICLPYFLTLCTDEQKARWLPGICSGELITAIAMTEPGIGSDLASMSTSAVLDGDHYLVNGSKTFITNGINADLVITAVKTDPTQRHAGMSLVVLERGMPGFERGRNLEKIGMHAQDTAELFFRDVRVPVGNLLGEEGRGFGYLMDNLPVERLAIAVGSTAAAEVALAQTVAYCREREAFGKKLGALQHVRFELAEMHTEVTLTRVFVDRCIGDLNQGTLSTETASMAKWWATDVAQRVADRCLQLFGGYGYMTEYPISRAWVDNRVAKIYGGSNEIMKEIIGRRLVAGD